MDRSSSRRALSGFLDEMGLAFFKRRRRGEAPKRPKSTERAVAVVQAFARHAFDDDTHSLELLERAVEGSMLATVLHYERREDAERRLDSLNAYLDTPIVLRLLGISLPQLTDAAIEMRDLLRVQGVACHVFHHTVEEVRGVLASTAGNLRVSRSKVHANTRGLSHTQREVLDHFIANGVGPGEVESISADLDRRLTKLGLVVTDTPGHERKLTIAEDELAQALQANVGYRNEGAKLRDIDSLTAIHRLRDGKSSSELGQAHAVFVTSNTALAGCTRSFMREHEHYNGIPHILSDIELTTQVWVRTPSAKPELPRKLLIADAYAALNPAGRLWDKYLAAIERLQQSGQIGEEQVTGLIHSMTARADLVDLTLGDSSEVDEATVVEVLTRLTDHLAQPLLDEERQRYEALRRANEARIATLEAEFETQRTQLETSKNDDISQLRAELDVERTTRLDRERRRAKTTKIGLTGLAIALGLAAAGVALFLSWTPLGRLALFLGLIACASAAYGFAHRSMSKATAALLAIATVLGTAVTVYLAPTDESDKPDPSNITTEP